MGSKPRRRKIFGNGGRDRISSLPDAILSHILSFLPTEYAVQTSILSKRWKYLWTGVTSLDLYSDYYFHESNAIDRFVNFVDRVLRLCNSAYFHKFRIRFSCQWLIDSHRIATWINEAIMRNVRELDLEIVVENFELPRSFFTCKTITVLKIYIDTFHVFDMPSSISFPSLKILHLEVFSPPTDLMQKLFRSCPVLEVLSIEGEVYPHHYPDGIELIFDVSAPALKRLRIHLDRDLYQEWQQKFVFNAPKLEFLDLHEEYLANYTVENLSSLVEASINIGDCCFIRSTSQAYANRAFELLKGISSVVHLSLRELTMGALDFGCHNNLPTFHNLTHLEMTISGCCGWKMLPNLLESSPNLKRLVLDTEYVHDIDEVPEDDYWSDPQSVPDCLSLHLVVIKIKGFEGKTDELKVVEYLLGNAKVLDNLHINCPTLSLEDEVKFCKNLLKFPRGSSKCQIQFFRGFSQKF